MNFGFAVSAKIRNSSKLRRGTLSKRFTIEAKIKRPSALAKDKVRLVCFIFYFIILLFFFYLSDLKEWVRSEKRNIPVLDESLYSEVAKHHHVLTLNKHLQAHKEEEKAKQTRNMKPLTFTIFITSAE